MYLNIGIDVAKDVHEACILNDKGEQIGKYIRIQNFKRSIEKFREHVESAALELNLIPRIGMEATGIYWYNKNNCWDASIRRSSKNLLWG